MFKILLTTALLGISSLSIAADKALLIGIGDYVNAPDLKGIDLDIINMRQAAKVLGFEQIRTLEDQQATEQNIIAQLKWLQQDIGPNDRVLIYFSGHGSQLRDQNGDEPDNLDEFLVAYDFKTQKTNNGVVASGLIVDDLFNVAIKAINTSQVYVFIDACQSGSATRSLEASGALGVDTVQTKFLKYDGMPKSAGIASTGIPMQDTNGANNFVAISAAGDTEYALASQNGSYFTLGLMKSLRDALSSGINGISPLKLHSQVVRFVHSKTNNKNRFTPVISGNKKLGSKLLSFKKTEQAGEYWQQMIAMVEGAGNNLPMTSNKKIFRLNEEIVVDIQVPIDGYLNIVTVSPNDRPQILFPNKFVQNSAVRRGKFSTRSLKFDLFATDPKGVNLTVAIVTAQPLNFYENSAFSRNLKGELYELVADLDANGVKEANQLLSRAIGLRASQDDIDTMFVGGIITEVR